MIKSKKIAVYAFVVLFVAGCASIMHGSSQEISFTSTPSQAAVTINGQSLGTTPVVLDLKRKKTHNVTIALEGYDDFELTLTRKTSGWVWGNILFGGVIGLIIDASNGAMYKISPEEITAEMRKAGTAMLQEDGGILIAVVLTANSDWEQIGSLHRRW